MKKRHLGTQSDGERIKKLLKAQQACWLRERLIALKMGFHAENSTEFIAESTGRSKATLQRWFASYRKGGLEAVLKRDYKGRTHTYFREEVKAYLKKGLQAGRWNTAVQAQLDLQKRFGFLAPCMRKGTRRKPRRSNAPSTAISRPCR